MADPEILVDGYPTAEAIAALPPGATVVIPFSGLPSRTRDLLLGRPDLRVYNLHHNADLVAEHAVALLLAAGRCLIPMDAALRRGDWRPRYEPDPSPSLHGMPALVLGHGAIGARVARVLEALGMDVRAIRRRGPFDGRVHPPEALDELLPSTRALVVALPHTPETDGLLDARRLALLPPEAVLVNVARGPVIDESALFEALRDRRLHAAGLDVWWRYPEREARDATPPAPFHELDNVVLSPHRAAHARETEALRQAHLDRLLEALRHGEEPGGRVDVEAGY